MRLFDVMGLVSTIALVLPIIILLRFKLAWYKSFPALLAYYVILFSYNLFLVKYIPVGKDVQRYHGIVNDLLYAPLVLYFLTYFSSNVQARKRMLILFYALIGFEAVILVIFGFTTQASKIITAPGLLLALAFSAYFFINRVKITIMHHKGIGKALIVSSLFFSVVGASYVFGVFYFTNAPSKEDAHVVFFLISVISSVSMSIGLFFEQGRVKHLEELRTVRNELKALYGEDKQKATTPFGTVALNFDKEQWN